MPRMTQISCRGSSQVGAIARTQTPNRSTTFSILMFFYDIGGVVHHELLTKRQTVNVKYYCDVHKHLRENIQHKCPELWCDSNSVLQHDSTAAHSVPKMCTFLTLK